MPARQARFNPLECRKTPFWRDDIRTRWTNPAAVRSDQTVILTAMESALAYPFEPVAADQLL